MQTVRYSRYTDQDLKDHTKMMDPKDECMRYFDSFHIASAWCTYANPTFKSWLEHKLEHKLDRAK